MADDTILQNVDAKSKVTMKVLDLTTYLLSQRRHADTSTSEKSNDVGASAKEKVGKKDHDAKHFVDST